VQSSVIPNEHGKQEYIRNQGSSSLTRSEVSQNPNPPRILQDTNMIRTTKALFARQTQTWADCPDWVEAIILDKIRGIIRAKIEKEHAVRRDRHEAYTDDWAAVAAELHSQASSQTTRWPAHQSQTPSDWVVVAAELQSQPSSQATQRPAHRIPTPSTRRIGTPVGQQNSQNDSPDTDLSFDFLQTSAAQVLGFLDASPPSADGSQEVTRELSLDRTVSPTPSRRLLLSLDRIEPAQQETSGSEWGDVEQGNNGSVGEGN